MIMGNDDERSHEAELINCMTEELIWEYMHNRSAQYGPYTVYGYSYVPPTPFLNKDWERYDISRYLDPGCVAPDEGFRSVEREINIIQHATIKEDLNNLVGDRDLQNRSCFSIHLHTKLNLIEQPWMGR